MKTLLTILALVLATGVLVTGALAMNLDQTQGAKPAAGTTPPPVQPDRIRQGGDTLEAATAITLPYAGGGTTVGYNDDYDEACPFGGSTSPDVVYTFTPVVDLGLDIDLDGSLYDTKVYVYDEDLTLIACNDDFYPDYVSKLENVPVLAGVAYYVVIDGYGGDAGEYTLAINEFEPCVLEIPADAVAEGEPDPEEGYQDCYNNGCSGECSTSFPDDMQPLLGNDAGTLTFHGRSGWYTFEGGSYRETDWFVAAFGPGGTIEVTVDAVHPVYLFELGPQDCASVAVLQNIIGGPCVPATLTVTGDPGSTAWLWVGPTTFEGPLGGFDYLLEITGLQPGPVATERHSWSTVKSLFQ